MRVSSHSDRRISAFLLVLACTIWAVYSGSAAQGTGSHAASSTGGENIFTNAQVLRIRIEVPREGMEILRDYHWRGFEGGQEKRPSVRATVRDGDNIYRDVAVHLKGAAGSFQAVDEQPALTLHFNKNIKGQTFHGLDKISLNNSVQDQSLLNEQICREMFAAAGVPVPRATHAKVELNGRDLGVYVLVEGYNKQFLARHFKNPNGNLYDGGFLKDVSDDLQKSSGPNPNDRSDLKRLAQAAAERNVTNRWKRLSEVLDVDEFITYLALDVIMCNWDGYGLNRNNYRIYHDPDSDKIVFMPHGLDQMFGVMRAGPDMTLSPGMQGLVARAVMQTPEGRRRYKERIPQLMDSVFHVEQITNRVWQLADQIRPVLAERGPGVVRSHRWEAQAFCDRIVERAKYIRRQLSAPDQMLKFDTAGTAPLGAWQPKASFGAPQLNEVTEGGHHLLHISASKGSVVGAWSTRVRLEPGRYRLEGKIKTQGVVVDPGDRRGGAGLRMSRQYLIQKVVGDTSWTDYTLDFEVGNAMPQMQMGFRGPMADENPDVELLCELRAAKGEVWFDADSLRLLQR
jgi:spore coat protein CotH